MAYHQYESVTDIPPQLDFTGEFGTELVCFLPFVHGLHATGQMARRRISTYRGMRPFYYFLTPGCIIERAEPRRHVNLADRPRYWPNPHEHFATRNPAERYPDFRARFANDLLRFDKPLLVVNNKASDEWGRGPVNAIGCGALATLFGLLGRQFQIVYVRQGLYDADASFSADHNAVVAFDDRAVLQAHPGVIAYDDLVRRYAGRFDYNTLKLMLFANCRHFISCQGGGSYLPAGFSGSALLILHRAGEELRFAYREGLYRHLSDPAPLCLVATDKARLLRGAELLARVTFCDGRASLPEHGLPLLPPPVADPAARIAELRTARMGAGDTPMANGSHPTSAGALVAGSM